MESSLECEECGKNFVNTAGLFTHQKKKCRPGKRSLQELLSDARDYWRTVSEEASSHKRPKLGSSSSSRSSRRPKQRSHKLNTELQEHSGTAASGEPDATMSANLREPLPLVGTSTAVLQTPGIGEENAARALERMSCERRPLQARFTTWRDKLGLFKKFLGSEKPIHDPEGSAHTPGAENGSVRCAQERHSSSQNLAQAAPIQGFQEPTPTNPAAPGHPAFEIDHRPDVSLEQSTAEAAGVPPSFYPYPNWSSFALGDWFWNRGTTNSKERFGELLQILRHQDFKTEDVCKTSWNLVDQILPKSINPPAADPSSTTNGPQYVDDTGFGWSSTEVVLEVPFPNHGKGRKVKPFVAGVLHHRSLVSVIKEKMSDPEEFRHHHLQPFELLWQPHLQKEPVPVYGEVYSSSEFLKIHEKVQNMPIDNPDNAGLERVVVALMFWSDVTLLANFGTAKLWPCYLFFGNDSKYRRGRPSANLCNHVAYFEELPTSFRDWYRAATNGKPPSQELITHCNRDMFHRQWDILLDDELEQAMRSGIRIACPDGVPRLFFPWIFTYSADYPEKTTIATIRPQGQRPCPRCLVPKSDLHNMGTQDDSSMRNSGVRVDDQQRQQKVELARSIVFAEGYAIGAGQVDHILQEDSLLPIQNAFSKLSSIGFDIHSSLVVDQMHEFELGVWKSLFVHMIRILEAQDRASRSSTSVQDLDWRYRQIPSFGVDTIRKFSSNASEQRRLGARDYENLLQCAIPAFHGLLPEPHNSIVCRLISLCAEWHALAKLRIHTEETVVLLETTTTLLGAHFRAFIETTCKAFETEESAKEYAARTKRSNARKTKSRKKKPSTQPAQPQGNVNSTEQNPGDPKEAIPQLETGNSTTSFTEIAASRTTSTSSAATSGSAARVQEIPHAAPPPAERLQRGSNSPPVASTKGKQHKVFCVDTYKYHALADYSNTIRRFGTTDSYSTETGEMEHKVPKSWFPQTDKKTYRRQLALIERRRANLRKIGQRVQNKDPQRLIPSAIARPADAGGPGSYEIAKSQSTYQGTNRFQCNEDNGSDPAYTDFLPDLNEHLQLRMVRVLARRRAESGQSADAAVDKTFISLRSNRIYEHKTLHVRYTAYDAREEVDIIRASGPKVNIMALNPAYPLNDQAHPFLYARVHGIFHANVLYKGVIKDSDPERMDFLWVRWYRWEGKSTSSHGLDLLSFPPVTAKGAFGFLDPVDVLRGCHIIPRFSSDNVILQENVSEAAYDSKDFPYYFVNLFADRDMYMRYQWGRAVGHEYTHSPGHPPRSLGTPAAFLAENAPSIQDLCSTAAEALACNMQPQSSPSELHPMVSPEPSTVDPLSNGLPSGEESSNPSQTAHVEEGEELGEDDMVFRGEDDWLSSDEDDDQSDDEFLSDS